MMSALFALSMLFARADDLNADELDNIALEQFQSIMNNNEAPAQQAPRAAPRLRRQVVTGATSSVASTSPGEVRVSLDRYEDLQRRAEPSQVTVNGPLVVLGAARYTGELVGDVLSLELELQVTLRGEGLWKTVPLVGEEAVIAAATVNGQSIPMARQSGYHVWATQETGEKTLTLSLLVPSQGPRGSLEFALPIAQTPATKFSADFPVEGLAPRLRRAIRSESVDIPGGTRLVADLEPTSRLHLVGFRALGDEEARAARVFAETLNLMSLDAGLQEQFVVIRYNILYAGQQRFDVEIPPGVEVVSAEGQGAFRYRLEGLTGGTTILRGETAYPIRDTYELSLRLARRSDAETFDVELPKCVGVEREVGWLGVEVTGNLKLDEVSRAGATAVDVRQLPWEMASSAIQPILKAYRYTDPSAALRLSAQALPEQEPASGAVDRIRADTVISPEGTALTDLRITLRNRLRHSLRMTLPPDAAVRSALLDGQPVRPSKAADGSVLFPLRRSGDASFTLQVILEQHVRQPSLIGPSALALPGLDLPTSRVSWTVYTPGNRIYSRLRGDISPQSIWGTSSWLGQRSGGTGNESASVTGFGGGLSAASDGAMPVRIALPREGTARSYTRYWVDADAPVTVRWWSSVRWLPIPARLLALLAGGWMVWAALLGALSHRRQEAALLIAGFVLMVVGVKLLPAIGLVGCVLGYAGWRRDLHQTTLKRLQEWWRLRRAAREAIDRSHLDRLGEVFRWAVAALVVLLLTTALFDFISVLGHPLG